MLIFSTVKSDKVQQIDEAKLLLRPEENRAGKRVVVNSDGGRTLAGGLVDTERRIKGYVNKGGKNNIGSSEFALIIRDREALTMWSYFRVSPRRP